MYANSHCAKCNLIQDYKIANLSVQCQPKIMIEGLTYFRDNDHQNHTTTEEPEMKKSGEPKIVHLSEMTDCTVFLQGK